MNRLSELYDGPYAAQTEDEEAMENIAAYVAMHGQ